MNNQQKVKAAFFDVDNTIVQLKTMFSFSEYLYLNSKEDLPFSSFEAFLNHLKNSPAAHDREKLNREFYKYYKGLTKPHLEILAARWFSELIKLHGEAMWHQPVLEIIRILRQQQYLIVAVSGSFREALTPLADYLGLDDCLATEIVSLNGTYTGEIAASFIGEGKASAIQNYALSNSISLNDCIACGDHLSDLSMLEIVGEPYVVSGDSALEKIARARQWPIINVCSQMNVLEATHV